MSNRGTGKTIPFSCYQTDAERSLDRSKTPLSTKASDTAVSLLYSMGETFANQCFYNAGTTGALISTAFVARDMMQIVDALGEDGLLRYWGKFSIAPFQLS